MPTIQANVSLIATAPVKATPSPRRLPRLAGWMLTAMVAGALWFGVVEAIRLVF